MTTLSDREYLISAFSDVLNHGADEITSPVDPMTFRTPEGDSCLHIAALRGDVRAVQLLLDQGMDPDVRGDMGSTPLHHATRRQHVTVARILLEHGASVSLLDEFGRRAGGE